MVTARKVKESEITEQDSLLQVTAQKVKESEKNLLTSSSATAPSSETDEEEETRESVVDIDPPTRKITKKYPKVSYCTLLIIAFLDRPIFNKWKNFCVKRSNNCLLKN
uniref:Uncharacterized protein LOC104211578 n=1 Tax=Nicotiana sylvestris TaxID=4096 RepID=A0A1U7UXR8_NICSY|nr:PREDICTED: uncharacterized protein LOC104211578 [Nicotiana sylvestris]